MSIIEVNEAELVLNFSENLQNLIKGHIKQNFAKSIGKTRFQVYRYLHAESLPDVRTLKKIADFFNVTMDFLISYNI